MLRVRSVWSGVAGVGITTLYFSDGSTGAVADTRQMWLDLAVRLPNEISIQVQNTGDVVNPATGDVTGDFSQAAVAAVAGTDTGVYARPAGAVINWLTATFIAGRRVRGKSYVVPIGSTAIDNDGTLSTLGINSLTSASGGLIASINSELQVWHRPTTPTGTNGSAHTVTSAQINDRVAVLRSRRD